MVLSARLKKLVTLVIVAAFVVVSTVTTIISLGAYCLTSDGGNTTALPHQRVIDR